MAAIPPWTLSWTLLFLLNIFAWSTYGAVYHQDADYLSHILDTALKVLENETWQEAWDENLQVGANNEDLGISYGCVREPSEEIPTSVNTLRPGDIKVVGAIGGSVTSALTLGVVEPFSLMAENRGESWCAGGDGQINHDGNDDFDTGVVTLANILKVFNADLRGYSLDYGYEITEQLRLNRAVSGALASELDSQIDTLVERMQEDGGWDEYAQDWKHLTFFVGLHDICMNCKNQTGHTAEEYIRHIENALDRLRQEIPRMIVSLVPVYNVANLGLLMDNLICEDMISLLCPCVVTDAEQTRTRQLQYYNALENLVSSRKYDTTLDFTVVLQPHMVNLGFPLDIKENDATIDRQYMGPDCFHPNRRGQRVLAFMLWNTMLTPVGHKLTRYSLTNDFRLACPSQEYPFIFTNNNSEGVDYTGPGFDDVIEDNSVDMVIVISVLTVASILVGLMIIGIIISSCGKKPVSKQPLEATRSDAPFFAFAYAESVDGERSQPEGWSRRESYDSIISSPDSRRPSVDFAVSPSSSRRGSLEPGQRTLTVTTSQLSRPGLYVRRGSEDLRREAFINHKSSIRRSSDGSIHIKSTRFADQPLISPNDGLGPHELQGIRGTSPDKKSTSSLISNSPEYKYHPQSPTLPPSPLAMSPISSPPEKITEETSDDESEQPQPEQPSPLKLRRFIMEQLAHTEV